MLGRGSEAAGPTHTHAQHKGPVVAAVQEPGAELNSAEGESTRLGRPSFWGHQEGQPLQWGALSPSFLLHPGTGFAGDCGASQQHEGT